MKLVRVFWTRLSALQKEWMLWQRHLELKLWHCASQPSQCPQNGLAVGMHSESDVICYITLNRHMFLNQDLMKVEFSPLTNWNGGWSDHIWPAVCVHSHCICLVQVKSGWPLWLDFGSSNECYGPLSCVATCLYISYIIMPEHCLSAMDCYLRYYTI